jgi:Alpha/beta hydrolase family
MAGRLSVLSVGEIDGTPVRDADVEDWSKVVEIGLLQLKQDVVIAYKAEQVVAIKDKLNKQAYHVVFHMVGTVAPQTAGRIAFDLFCRPPSVPLDRGSQRLVERMTPLFESAEIRNVMFRDGVVQAYHWPARQAVSMGRVLLVHGWTGRAMVMGLFVEPLLKAGFDVVALDLPAHGLSDGTRLSLPIGARAVQAVAHAFGPITGAITHSFGGPVVALAMEGGPPLNESLKLARVVMIASPNKLSAMTDRFATSRFEQIRGPCGPQAD